MTAETALRVLREFDAHDYAEDYEFRADGDYRPSEQEKTLIEDAILGALGAVEERIRAVSNARENFEFAGQAALDAAIRELELAQAEIERVRMHLGNVLSTLAELHQDDRCAALDEALAYYNANCPDKQVVPVEGYVTRLVQYGPLDAVIEKLALPVEIIKAKARKAAIEEAEKATWIGLQPYVDNLTQGKHPELVTFRLLTDIRATIRALAEDANV